MPPTSSLDLDSTFFRCAINRSFRSSSRSAFGVLFLEVVVPAKSEIRVFGAAGIRLTWVLVKPDGLGKPDGLEGRAKEERSLPQSFQDMRPGA